MPGIKVEIEMTPYEVKTKQTNKNYHMTPQIPLQKLKARTWTEVHHSIIHHSQKVESTEVSANTWMDKQNVYTYNENYSNIKRNEVLIHATSWMNLENIVLNEISQIQEDKYYRSPCTGNT